MYINDLGEHLCSFLSLLADDTVIYRIVRSSEDQYQLQNDLEKISVWRDKCQLTLNKEKCEVVHMSTKRNPLNFSYTINCTNLKAVNSTKYIGITVAYNFNWKEHIDNIVGKANERLTLLAEHFEDATNPLKRQPILRLSVSAGTLLRSVRCVSDRIEGGN